MSWPNLLEQLRDPGTLAYFSLSDLPTQAGSIANLPEVTLMSMPLSGQVKLDTQVPPELEAALVSLDLMPSRIETGWPEPGKYARLAALSPHQGGARLAAEKALQNPWYDFAPGAFEALLSRAFLLIGCRDRLPVPPALQVSECDEMSDDAIWCRLNARPGTGHGVLLRSNYSIQGNSIESLTHPSQLGKARRDPRDLVVRRYSADEIQKDLEFCLEITPDGAELLGCVEQISDRQRKYGAKSIELSQEIQSQIASIIARLEPILRKQGVRRGIFGLDAFVVSVGGGQPQLIVYDLNPCASQAFFPLALHQRLHAESGTPTQFATGMFSIFAPRGTPIQFNWKRLDGPVPLMVQRRSDPKDRYERWVVMTLWTQPMSAQKREMPQESLLRWVNSLKLASPPGTIRISPMFF